ncbi:MAG: tetratricopeptide repeat protein [Planctomycetes bacterium]|nr:tetratricopeptide repeat protein [Planctomycetota bacterium]
MAEPEDKQPDATADDLPPEEEGLTLQERIDREMERRRAEKARKAAAQAGAQAAAQAGGTGAETPDEAGGGEEDAKGAAAAARAADGAGQGPDEATAGEDAQAGEDHVPASTALQEAIARKRAALQAKLQGEQQEEDAPAEGPQQDAAGEDSAPAGPATAAKNKRKSPPLKTMVGQQVSLQQIIAQQREKLKARLQDSSAEPGDRQKKPAEDIRALGLTAKKTQADEDDADEKDQAATSGEPAVQKGGQVVTVPAGRSVLSTAVLVMNTFLLAVIGGVLLYSLSHQSNKPSAAAAAVAAVEQVQRARAGQAEQAGPVARSRPAGRVRRARPAGTGSGAGGPAADTAAGGKSAGGASRTGGATAAAMEVPSWAAAESAYENKNYDAAAERYSRLLLASRSAPSEALCGDFYQYRLAQCIWQLGRAEQARRVLEKLRYSDSPAVRASAAAALARLAEADGRYLHSRMLAYQAIADLQALSDREALEADCDYIVARVVTSKVRTFHATGQVIPWSRVELTDMFAGRSEAAIRRMLETGAVRGGASGEPLIRISQASGAWNVLARNASLEDVLQQFSTASGLDVQWRQVPPPVRRRRVTFSFAALSQQRICELACGMAGLAAKFTWDHVVVYDPQGMESVAAQREFLSAEAIALWRRFALRHPKDRRVPESLFALGALYEWAGDVVAAMKQYQLLGRQYQQEQVLSPKALIRSAELRITLRDYAGARRDLQDVLDLHPHYPRSDEVQLTLGRVDVQSGRYEEAVRIFLRVYTLNNSSESRRAACLAIGECYWRQGDYPQASKWLCRYLTSAGGRPGGEVVRAYLLLGQSESARGNKSAAAEAFRRALALNPDHDDYVEAVLLLAQASTDEGDFIGALGTIRKIEQEKLSDRQRYRYLMVLSDLYRRMRLPDRARAILREKAVSLSDPHLRAKIAVEQARCLREAGDLIGARQGLTEALADLPAGLDAWKASLELADLCLQMHDSDQAAVVAREVLRGKCPEDIRRRAVELLGRAQLAKGQYDQAALTLASLSAASAQGKATSAKAGGKKP